MDHKAAAVSSVFTRLILYIYGIWFSRKEKKNISWFEGSANCISKETNPVLWLSTKYFSAFSKREN